MQFRFAILLAAMPLASLMAEETPAPPVAEGTKAAAPAPEKPPANPLDSVPMDKVSYYIGRYVFGRQMATQGYTPDFEALKKGFKDAFDEKEAPFPMDDMKAAMGKFSAAMREVDIQRKAKLAAAGTAAAKEGEEFLEKNSERDGVKQTYSGLQYEVLTPAEGPTPNAVDSVTVNYKGTFIDGKDFDSNEGKPPVTFTLTSVIKGWNEGLRLMNKGSKFKFYIPSKLAYGERGEARAHIVPNQTLIFEVELLDIKPGEAPPAPPKPPKRKEDDN